MVYSSDRSKSLLLCGLFYRGDLFYVLHCVILFLCFFSPFSISITSLGEERANPSAFRTFVRFALVWFCLFPLPLGVWEGLRFVIVALPGRFSYFFFCYNSSSVSNISHKVYMPLYASGSPSLSGGINAYSSPYRRDLSLSLTHVSRNSILSLLHLRVNFILGCIVFS